MPVTVLVTAALGALSSTSPGVVQLSFSLLPSSILNRLGKLVNEIAHSGVRNSAPLNYLK